MGKHQRKVYVLTYEDKDGVAWNEGVVSSLAKAKDWANLTTDSGILSYEVWNVR